MYPFVLGVFFSPEGKNDQPLGGESTKRRIYHDAVASQEKGGLLAAADRSGQLNERGKSRRGRRGGSSAATTKREMLSVGRASRWKRNFSPSRSHRNTSLVGGKAFFRKSPSLCLHEEEEVCVVDVTKKGTSLC